MDFAYDRIQAIQTPPPAEEGKHDTPIDQAADKLEERIEGVYSKISGTDWKGLWSTFKRQGEAALSETKKELGSLLADKDASSSASADAGASARDASGSATASGESSSTNLAASSDTITPRGPTMLGELTKKAQQYVDELDKELEEIENKAGAYLGKFGTGLKTVLKDAVAIAAPGEANTSTGDERALEEGEDAPAEILFNVPEDIRTQIYSTRLDAQLHALHTSEQPFLTETKEAGYDEFKKTFDLDSKTADIAKELDTHADLRRLMDSLVPEKVPYADFWTKYFYMRREIHEQEQRRRELLSKAGADNEDEVGWDDDDDADTNKTAGAEPEAGPSALHESRASSDNSYDIISKTSSAVDLPSSKGNDNDDSDEDWE